MVVDVLTMTYTSIFACSTKHRYRVQLYPGISEKRKILWRTHTFKELTVHMGENREHFYGFSRLDKATVCTSIEWLIWCIDIINGEPFILLKYGTRPFEPIPPDIPCIRGPKTEKKNCAHVYGTPPRLKHKNPKSNRCIWHTTLVIWLLNLTRPESSNRTKFRFWFVLNIFT
jgi:hypothetical protein